MRSMGNNPSGLSIKPLEQIKGIGFVYLGLMLHRSFLFVNILC